MQAQKRPVVSEIEACCFAGAVSVNICGCKNGRPARMSFVAEKLILQNCKSQVVAAVCTIFPQPVPPLHFAATKLSQFQHLSSRGGDPAKPGDEVTEHCGNGSVIRGQRPKLSQYVKLWYIYINWCCFRGKSKIVRAWWATKGQYSLGQNFA